MLPESDLDWILLESVCMADALGESTGQSKLHAIFRVFGEGELVLALRSILETWVLLVLLNAMRYTVFVQQICISRIGGRRVGMRRSGSGNGAR